MEIIIGVNVVLLITVGYLHWRLSVVGKHLITVMKSQSSTNDSVVESAIHDKYLMYKTGHIDANTFVQLTKPMAELNPQMVDWFVDVVNRTEVAEKEQEDNND